MVEVNCYEYIIHWKKKIMTRVCVFVCVCSVRAHGHRAHKKSQLSPESQFLILTVPRVGSRHPADAHRTHGEWYNVFI